MKFKSKKPKRTNISTITMIKMTISNPTVTISFDTKNYDKRSRQIESLKKKFRPTIEKNFY